MTITDTEKGRTGIAPTYLHTTQLSLFIAHIVGLIVSGVRVRVSFQSIAIRMFVCTVMLFAVPCARKVIFLSRLRIGGQLFALIQMRIRSNIT